MSRVVRIVVSLVIAAAWFGVPPVAGHASVCGFYEDDRVAYYNHCGDTWVRIHVDKSRWFHDEEFCVRPGVTGLGSAEEVDNAYYIDNEC